MKIAIIEDEVIIALTLKRKLEAQGHEVCPMAVTGIKAIKDILEENPDLILMDIRLKGDMNGIEAIWEIKKRGSKAKIIFMTGYGDPQMREKAESCEPVAFLEKPVRFERLKALIDSCLM